MVLVKNPEQFMAFKPGHIRPYPFHLQTVGQITFYIILQGFSLPVSLKNISPWNFGLSKFLINRIGENQKEILVGKPKVGKYQEIGNQGA